MEMRRAWSWTALAAKILTTSNIGEGSQPVSLAPGLFTPYDLLKEVQKFSGQSAKQSQ